MMLPQTLEQSIFRKLAFLVPGSAPRSPRGSLGSFRSNGQREKSDLFLLDGNRTHETIA